METLTSETDLAACFRAIDRDEVEPPPLAFPLEIDGVLAWATGPRAFLLFVDRPGRRPRGIVFHRSTSPLPDAAAMCEWCHAVRATGGVKLMSVRADERRRLGLYLCGDLACVARAHEPPAPGDVPERLDREERARRVHARIAEFAARRLF